MSEGWPSTMKVLKWVPPNSSARQAEERGEQWLEGKAWDHENQETSRNMSMSRRVCFGEQNKDMGNNCPPSTTSSSQSGTFSRVLKTMMNRHYRKQPGIHDGMMGSKGQGGGKPKESLCQGFTARSNQSTNPLGQSCGFIHSLCAFLCIRFFCEVLFTQSQFLQFFGVFDFFLFKPGLTSGSQRLVIRTQGWATATPWVAFFQVSGFEG